METINKFLTENINQAILSTQFDMRGFVHPLGFRSEGISAKSLSYIPYNLLAFAGGAGKEDAEGNPMKMTIDQDIWFEYFDKDLTYKKVLNVCKKFSSECDIVSKEAVQLLLKDVLNKTEELKAVATKEEGSAYLRPLDKKSNWGKIMLGLMEAFDVKVNEPFTVNTW